MKLAVVPLYFDTQHLREEVPGLSVEDEQLNQIRRKDQGSIETEPGIYYLGQPGKFPRLELGEGSLFCIGSHGEN